MSRFTDKALTKIAKLTPDEIARILESQSSDIRYRSEVLDASDLGYVLVDKDGMLLYFNTTMYSLAPCYKRNVSDSVHITKFIKDKEICSFILNSIARNLDEEYQYIHESSMYGKMDIRIYSSKITDKNLKLFCFQDVTFLKKIRAEYLKNESLAAMTTMAAGIAHEIKNPLASISIYLQLLQRKLEADGCLKKEDAEKSLSIISDEIERLNAISVDFLFAVKPVNIKTELTSANKVAEKACNIAEPEVKERNITLVRDFATSLPNADLDPNLIEQSILNLIRNAMQSIEEGRNDGVITVHTALSGDTIKISVEDNGCGMTEEQLGKIFEPYYTTKANGTGLGLTNIFKIIKLHNGEVLVKSEYGSGSEFTISLPVPRSERYRLATSGDRA